ADTAGVGAAASAAGSSAATACASKAKRWFNVLRLSMRCREALAAMVEPSNAARVVGVMPRATATPTISWSQTSSWGPRRRGWGAGRGGRGAGMGWGLVRGGESRTRAGGLLVSWWGIPVGRNPDYGENPHRQRGQNTSKLCVTNHLKARRALNGVKTDRNQNP